MESESDNRNKGDVMENFEKLGLFYMGKEYDMANKKTTEDLVLLKSKDLTTHAVIIGMTGSGKTGLGLSLIEEAMMDNIPVIAIDPKGDLSNLALTFPNLKGEDFLPWINHQEAATKNMTPEEYAAAQAELWKNGLASWGQSGERIEALRKASDVRIFTPGGSGGIGVSLLKSFDAPSPELRNDREAFRERIGVTVTSLLSLVGIEADPFTSPEYILLANIIEMSWSAGKNVSLEDLITQVQTPPITKVGVMDLDSFYPAKDRFKLAMMFNNLLASPGFEAWLEGQPLDVDRFLYGSGGKPQVSVFSIAHLGDRERMFFVTMLLNEILSWVRSQPGTGSLRALLYMDELFGYLPPTANPPSKGPLLTLLKQARAFGLGLVLSTQNPVDLDYKALSNAGTWFIGRLQTERDKERVLAGLEGAAAGGTFDKSATERILAGIGQRVFYLHSVHENEPIIFGTRWAMSYLAGPMTKNQLAKLPDEHIESGQPPVKAAAGRTQSNVSEAVRPEATAVETASAAQGVPILSSQIKQVFIPPSKRPSGDISYNPAVIGVADVLYTNARYGINATQSYTLLAPIHDGPVPIDWAEAEAVEIDIRSLETTPLPGAKFVEAPEAVTNIKNYDTWKRLLTQHIRTNMSIKLLTCPDIKLVSKFEEEERAFMIRLQHAIHEKRDTDLEAMKKKYASKIQTLDSRLQSARQAVEKQNAMASQKKLDAMVSAGSAVLGALLGKKAVTASSVSKVGTAVRRTSTAMKSGQGIEQAQEKYDAIDIQLQDLQIEMEGELAAITERYEAMKDRVEEIEIRPASTNATVHLIGLAWVPKV